MILKKTIIILLIILSIVFGVYFGFKIFDKNTLKSDEKDKINNINDNKNEVMPITEISSKEERTTPNTLIIYKTYYTKCKHYIQEYETIDVSMVNLNKEEFLEKNKGWTIESFTSKEVIIGKEEEKFCNQHYKIKIKDDIIVIYSVDENGREMEYEKTEITTEYLTPEDIKKLQSGIIIFGKENLISAIEDYE